MIDDNLKNNPKEQVIDLTKQDTETSSNSVIDKINSILETFNSNSIKQTTFFLDFNDYLIKNNEILTNLNASLLAISNQFIFNNRDFTIRVQENQNANFIWYLGKSAYLLEQLNEKLEKENFNTNLYDVLKDNNYEKIKANTNTDDKLKIDLYDLFFKKNDKIQISQYIPNNNINLENMPDLYGTIYDTKSQNSKLNNLAKQETLARLETGIDLEKTDKNFRYETENQKKLDDTSRNLKETLSKANENREIDDNIQQAINEFNEIPKLIDILNTETKTLRAKKDDETKELVIQRAKEYDTLKDKLKELSSPTSDDKFIKVFGTDGEFARTYFVDSIKESLQLYNTELYENMTKLLNSDVKSTKKGLKSIFNKASDFNNKITNFTFEEDDSIKNINAEFDLTKKTNNENDSIKKTNNEKENNNNNNNNNKHLDDIKEILKELLIEIKNENKERKVKKDNLQEQSSMILEDDIKDISKSLKGIFNIFSDD